MNVARRLWSWPGLLANHSLESGFHRSDESEALFRIAAEPFFGAGHGLDDVLQNIAIFVFDHKRRLNKPGRRRDQKPFAIFNFKNFESFLDGKMPLVPKKIHELRIIVPP